MAQPKRHDQEEEVRNAQFGWKLWDFFDVFTKNNYFFKNRSHFARNFNSKIGIFECESCDFYSEFSSMRCVPFWSVLGHFSNEMSDLL